MIRLDPGTKGAWKKTRKKTSMKKKNDEETNGDGVVTMKTHEKTYGEFACKRIHGCKTW